MWLHLVSTINTEYYMNKIKGRKVYIKQNYTILMFGSLWMNDFNTKEIKN